MKEDLKNIVKNTVDNFSDDINPDLIWDGIETKMSKKNKVSGYWIFGGLSLVVASLFFAWSFKNTVAIPSADVLESVYQSNEEDIIKTKKLDSNKSTFNKISTQTNELIAINTESKEVIKELKNSNSIHSNESPINLLNTSENGEKEIIKNEKTEVANNILINLDGEKGKGRNENIVAENITSKKTNNDFIDSMSGITTPPNVIKHESFGAATNSKIDLIGPMEKAEMRTNIDLAKLRNQSANLFSLPKREINMPDADAFNFNFPGVPAENKIHLFSGLEIYSGLSYGDKTVSGIDQSYAKIRNDSEKLLEQWSTGVSLDLFKLKDIRFRSGVRFSMITDQLLQANIYLDESNYSYVTSRLEGDDIVLIDNLIMSDSIPFSGTYTIEQYNSQRIISIPIELTFGKSLNKMNFGIGFGVDVNYQLKDTHVILNQDEKASVNRVGGKWVSPSLSAALSAGYNINDTWSIVSRINFRQITLMDHESISTLTSSYKLYGLELGLRKNFGK